MAQTVTPHCVRIGYQNIGPQRRNKSTNHARQTARHLSEGQYDAYLFVEHSTNWRRIDSLHRWHCRMREIFNDSTSWIASNEHASHTSQSPFLPGGTGVTLLDAFASRRWEAGTETTTLGRWTWMSIQGRHGIKTILVAAYRPVRNPNGAMSTWSQHLNYLRSNNDTRDPHQAFDDDIMKALKDWIEAGYQIVLGMDMNDNTTASPLATRFQSIGLREAIQSHHAPRKPPATYNRNMTGIPIDGIWVTPAITIQKAGYLGFDMGCPSDHRTLWIDVTKNSLLGSNPPRLIRPVSNRLNCKDPRVNRRYTVRVLQAYRQAHIRTKMDHLQQLADTVYSGHSELQPSLERAYNDLHLETTQIRLSIAESIRKIRRGQIPWSPRLQRYRDTIELWKRALKKAQGVTTSPTMLQRLAKKCNEPTAIHADVETATKQVKHAYRQYRLAKGQAENWRTDHQENLAEALAEQNRTTQVQELERMRREERQRSQGRAARRTRGRMNKQAVTKVLTIDHRGIEVECTTQEAIVQACATSNYARQIQAKDTPFMTYPLCNLVGLLADGPAVPAILDGTFQCPPSVDKYTRAFIEELKCPATVEEQPEISNLVSLTDHQEAWNKQSAHTASEPSTLSFNHYKICARDEFLGSVDALLREIPLRSGMIPTQWRRITDVEILKKANTFQVDKMRLIQLMPADYNINNKMIGRRMMYTAEKNHTLADDQYGSRKHRKSAIVALHKRLVMDLWRQHRQAGAICMNDAKSCYDRIVHAPAILCMRRQGVPANVCRSLFGTLQSATHCISTGFGVSEPVYGGTDADPPLQGAGQGNGKAPAVWAVISSVLIQMMYTAGHGLYMLTALTCTIIRLTCFAFVDDTDTVQTGPTVNSTGEEVLPLLQDAVDCWEGGLWASGGSIVPSKIFWYLIDFRWSSRGWKYRRKDSMPWELTVRNQERQRVTLRRLDPHEATTTLGVPMAMDGSTKPVVEALRAKSVEFGDAIRTSALNHNDAWFTLTASFLKTLEYPTAACNLSRADWESILAPALRYALPKCGLARNFPRAVLYGPKSHQGLGFPHPYYQQMIIHLQTWMEAFLQQNTTALLLQGSFESLALELGFPGKFGTADYRRYHKCTTDGWMKSLWDFAWKNQLEIHFECEFPSLLRHHDRYLMQLFGDDPSLSTNDLRKLNECRMFLSAISMADITTIDGLKISEEMFNGSHLSAIFRRKLQWPRQPRHLPTSYWSLWRKALRRLCTDRRILTQPLGSWFRPQEVQKLWPWWGRWQGNAFLLFHLQADGRWRQYDHPTSPNRLLLRERSIPTMEFYPAPNILTQPPALQDFNPCSVHHTSPREPTIRVICQGSIQDEAPPPPPPLVHQDYRPPQPAPPIPNRPDSPLHRTLLSYCAQTDVPLDVFALSAEAVPVLHTAAANGTLRVVSDGSYKDGAGAAGWIIAGAEDGSQFTLSGVNWVLGGIDDHGSLRSELMGVLGALYCILAICDTYQLPSTMATIGLDGQSAIQTIIRPGHLSAGQPSVDLVACIRALIRRIHVDWKWVEGHQIEKYHRKLQDLDWWGRLNEAADELAKQHLQQEVRRQRLQTNIQWKHEPFAIFHEGVKLACIHHNRLYSDLLMDEICEYWVSKHDLSWDDIDDISWRDSQRAIQSLPLGIQRWHTKFSSGHCGVGRMEFRRGHQSHSRCPRCHQPDESTRHVLQCKAPRARQAWNRSLAQFTTGMEKINTAPWIQFLILHILNTWRRTNTMTYPATHANYPFMFQLFRAQARHPWWNFLLGRWSSEWVESQAQFLSLTESQQDPHRWLSSIIRLLLLLAWDMWSDRNDALHGEAGLLRTNLIRDTHNTVRAEFARGYLQLPDSEHHWFQQTLPELLSKPVQYLQHWLECVRTARQFHANPPPAPPVPRAQIRQQEFLQRWLTRNQNPT